MDHSETTPEEQAHWELKCEVKVLQDLCEKSIAERQRLSEENQELRRVLRLIIGMAGNPDPEKGCRIIIHECQRVLDEYLK